MQPTAPNASRPAVPQIEVFQYPAGPNQPAKTYWEGWDAGSEGADGAAQAGHEQARSSVETALRGEFDKRMAEETRKAFDAGRERGRQDGRQAEREAQGAALAAAQEQRLEQAARMVEGFAAERDRFLHAVEGEVVELALAVAARILRREAQMDPLLLTGAVRVALGQLSQSTRVRLRVPAGELGLWTEAMALLPNLALKPTVLAGEGMRLGDCLIETELGSVDLGIRAQLGEIERGFFDRASGGRTISAVVEGLEGRETRA